MASLLLLEVLSSYHYLIEYGI
jgi:hypothetical protein